MQQGTRWPGGRCRDMDVGDLDGCLLMKSSGDVYPGSGAEVGKYIHLVVAGGAVHGWSTGAGGSRATPLGTFCRRPSGVHIGH